MNSPVEEQQENQEQNLQDIIAETFDEMEESGEEETDEEVEVSEEETEEAHAASDEESEDEEPIEEVSEAEEQLQDEIDEAAESDYSEPAPERWPTEIKKVYNELPPQARKAMLEGIYKPMQAKYTQSTQELAKMKQGINPMLEAMSQYRGDFERMGVNPVDAFRTQMAWAAHLHKVGPEQGLKDMRSAYGLDTAQKQDQTPAEYLTPAERAMKAQIDQLQQQVQGQQQSYADSQRQAVEAQKAQYKQEINHALLAFSNEKSEDGQLAHPHMERVAMGIAGVIRGGLVKTTNDYGQPVSLRDQIAQAYQHACNLDPTIRTPVQNARQVNKVKAAQKVGVVNKEPAGSVTEDSETDISDFISKTFDMLNRRAG